MVHEDVYKKFELYFPIFAGENVDTWFTNGKNCIRVRLKNGQSLIFSYGGKNEWRLETTKSFLKNGRR